VIFKSPAKAALAPIYMASSNDYKDQTGEYLHMFNPKRMDEKVYDALEGERLWSASADLWARIDRRAAVMP